MKVEDPGCSEGMKSLFHTGEALLVSRVRAFMVDFRNTFFSMHIDVCPKFLEKSLFFYLFPWGALSVSRVRAFVVDTIFFMSEPAPLIGTVENLGIGTDMCQYNEGRGFFIFNEIEFENEKMGQLTFLK